MNVGTILCGCELQEHDTKLIAVTGGPGAGKTAILEMAMRSFCRHVGTVPEAATIAFGGGFPREGSDSARGAAQRAIFHIQRELERIAVEDRSVAIALCDRGTVDGVAYWPGPPTAFWLQVGSSPDVELMRYAAVIHLSTPTEQHGYNHVNKLRTETALEAAHLDGEIAAGWRDHPNRFVVSSRVDFVEKAAEVIALIRSQLPACCASATNGKFSS